MATDPKSEFVPYRRWRTTLYWSAASITLITITIIAIILTVLTIAAMTEMIRLFGSVS